jgi:hypothetical protein
MLKSGVKLSIRRTGAEIIDFLVFRNKFLKDVLTVDLWRKMEVEMNYSPNSV